MIEAVKFWNEPNNKSHWNFELDPEWRTFSEMVKLAALAAKAEKPDIIRVLGGISPIDALFMERMKNAGTLENMNAVGVHGFPLDWNHWSINEWPDKIAEIKAITDLPIWVTEVGVSTFGAEEVQEFGFRRTAELLSGKVDRIHWYSLYVCLRPGEQQPAIAKQKVLPTTAIFIWDCYMRTEPRNLHLNSFLTTHRSLACANGSTLKTIAWNRP
jgi:beta-xylosidase